MPTVNLSVAWVSIGLQMLAVVRLARRSYTFPGMMAYAAGSLAVVWFALEQWNLAWSVGAWAMLLFKLVVVVEAVAYVVTALDEKHDALMWILIATLGATLAAMALDRQSSILYSARFVCHTAFASAALASLPFAKFSHPHERAHVGLVGFYFLGMALGDFNAPRELSPRYWTIHLWLAAMQAACWFGWVALFTDLRHQVAGRASHLAGRNAA